MIILMLAALLGWALLLSVVPLFSGRLRGMLDAAKTITFGIDPRNDPESRQDAPPWRL